MLLLCILHAVLHWPRPRPILQRNGGITVVTDRSDRTDHWRKTVRSALTCLLQYLAGIAASASSSVICRAINVDSDSESRVEMSRAVSMAWVLMVHGPVDICDRRRRSFGTCYSIIILYPSLVYIFFRGRELARAVESFPKETPRRSREETTLDHLIDLVGGCPLAHLSPISRPSLIHPIPRIL